MRQFFGTQVFLLVALFGVSTVMSAEHVAAQAAEAASAAKSAEKPEAKTAAKDSDSEKSSDEKTGADSDQKPAEKAADESTKDKSDDKAEKKEPVGDSDEKETKDAKTEKSKKDDEKKKAKPHTVKRDKIKIEVSLNGIFVADEMEEVLLRPEAWSTFRVLEAVEHGTTVKKGDVLVKFDAEKLEKKLASESLDQRIGELAMMQEEEEFPRAKRLAELNFQTAKRGHEQMEHDYKYYHDVDRPFMLRIAKFRFKSSGEQLATAKEELKQLQQMYEADELTEETEEIVLRRQRFSVESAELSHELAEENLGYTLGVSIPRTDEYYENARERAELAYKQAKTAQELGTTRNTFEMEKKREKRSESVELHGKLLSDKQLMEIRAPADGVVYYGQCKDGKWSQVAALQPKLKKFGVVSPNSVLMTIVTPGPMHVEATLTEKQLPEFKKDMVATVVPTADEDEELEGKIAKLDSIPGPSNKFGIRFDVDTDSAPSWLVAGMTCDAKVVTYEKKDAIVVPQDLVQTDEDDEKTKYVMVVEDENEDPVRREVKLGRKQDKNVEVVEGLDEGDQIVKEEKKKDEKNDDE